MAVKTKAAILAEIASLFADNATGDISASDLRTVTNDITDSYFDAPYTKYVALLTQTGTDAPVATVLENTLSGTPVWSYVGAGSYLMTLTGEFLEPKTYCIINQQYTGIDFRAGRNNDNSIYVSSDVAGIFSDAQLFYTSIEIRVYA